MATSRALWPCSGTRSTRSSRGGDLQVDELPGIAGVSDCSLVLRVGEADRGIRPSDGTAANAFECVARPETWTTVAVQLEPFATPRADRRHIHQYLTEAGDIEWIISTDRSW